MKEKSQIEKKAEEKQTELLSAALGGASNAGGHWQIGRASCRERVF